MSRFRRAAIAALALTLAVAPAVSAATTGDVSETFVVNSTLSLTLDKSSIDYGSIDPGSTTSTPALDRRVTASVGGNVTAWTLTVTGGDYTRTGGGTLPASVRDVKLMPSGDWQDVPITATGNGPGSAAFEFAAVIPNNAPAGSYTGTITFTVTGS